MKILGIGTHGAGGGPLQVRPVFFFSSSWCVENAVRHTVVSLSLLGLYICLSLEYTEMNDGGEKVGSPL